MKINHGYQDSRAASANDASKTQETAAAAQSKAARAGAGGKASPGDEVNLSSLASVLQGALSESPERAAYLERLAGEYAAGTYNPDPQATAKAIVSDTLTDSSGTKQPDKA